jgi:hypothetical protein
MLRGLQIFFFLASCFLTAWSESVTWTGWISDSKCGAKMTGYCAKACITAGEKPVFISEDKQVIPITNPERTKGYEGEHVVVRGSASEGKLTISSIDRAVPR